MKHREFSLNSNKASCLGMVFKTNRENSLLSNLEPKIVEFEEMFNAMASQKTETDGQDCCNEIL